MRPFPEDDDALDLMEEDALPEVHVTNVDRYGTFEANPLGADIGEVAGSLLGPTITGGIGHNIPQEAPQEFADAIVEVDGW